MNERAGTATVDTGVDTEDIEAADAVPATAQAGGTKDGTEDGTESDAPAPGRRSRIAGAVLAAALLVIGGLLFAEGRQLRDTPATSNRALTDTGATAEVVGDVSSALGTVFSYSPRATAATKASAKEVLAGKALKQYAALFGQVEKQAADQELTLTTQVVRAGVTRLTGNSAHLLVFLDQVYERRGKAPTTAAAQLSVSAELRDGRWYIVEITSR
ncbi:hypothetical protein [Streptomyces sp. NPDC048560]|uniref:hypothetical protein n=1 Tax=Streptomyces sp. NPDC048560 TaxID=3155488 RepID=UPI00341BFAFC